MPPMQSLRITPDRNLEFPFTPEKPIPINLQLENVRERPVAFKIKTTAPKSYIVRPSTGVLPAKGERMVQIVMQPLKEAPVTCSDRFLIQAVRVDDESVQLSKEFWASVDKETVEDQRLNVYIAAGQRPQPTDDARSAPVNMSSTQLQAKYDQVMEYCYSLEKNVRELRSQLDAAQRELAEARVASAASASASPMEKRADVIKDGKGGFSLWQVFVIVLVSLGVLKFTGLLTK